VLEAFNGSVWGSVGGGPSLGNDSILRTNDKSIIENLTVNNHETTFTVDTGAETLDVGTSDGFSNEDTVYVTTTTTLPSPLTANTQYYVISATSSTIQLATTNGGSAINITTAGSGTHTIYQAINAMSAGPITIETGHTVTIPSGSNWTIV
jgi:hypothetical protein